MAWLSVAGLAGATLTVAATTLDDAIWLVPFVGSSAAWSLTARVAHAAIFVATLESMAMVSVGAALVLAHGVSWMDSIVKEEILLGSIAALLCWSLAIFFGVRKLLKRRRRQQQQAESKTLLGGAEGVGDYESTAAGLDESLATDASPKPLLCGNIGTVMSLTVLGALDELSYFPALVLGKIFTPLEVCMGTILAAVLVLILITCCIAKFQPLIDCLDRIPIYAVIALFAAILTAEVIYDIIEGNPNQ